LQERFFVNFINIFGAKEEQHLRRQFFGAFNGSQNLAKMHKIMATFATLKTKIFRKISA
jgi:hypothetical protein